MAKWGRTLLPALVLVGASLGVHAELEPVSDETLRNVVGQAMIAADVRETAAGDFTRITLGMDAELQTNFTNVTLGQIDQTGEPTGADFLVDQLSFGHIVWDDTKVQIDGQTHAVNEFVPFVVRNPFFEIREDADAGDVVGFRMGFGEARGTISGDISSFSGNIGLKLEDDTGAVQDAQLMNADGTVDNRRATHIGLSTPTTDCAAGVNCAPLSNLQTLDVGVDNGDGTVGFTKEFFISFQKEPVEWETDPATGATVATDPGVFINLPTAMTLDMQQLQNGVPRARTEFIDRGLGLF